MGQVFDACEFRPVLTGAVITDQVRYTGGWDKGGRFL